MPDSLTELCETLEAIYDQLRFGQIHDNAFKALVLVRIIEPTSKADTVRVLAELGAPGPTRVTFMRCLDRASAPAPVGDASSATNGSHFAGPRAIQGLRCEVECREAWSAMELFRRRMEFPWVRCRLLPCGPKV